MMRFLCLGYSPFLFCLILAGCGNDQTQRIPGGDSSGFTSYDGDDDYDGILNADDNCPSSPNPDQADTDEDGAGDACDEFQHLPCAGRGGDRDGDEVCQMLDNCPTEKNADQKDTDGDGLGDACDEQKNTCDLAGDDDGDGVCTATDNCPLVANPDQANADGDSLGDACDPVDGNDPCLERGLDADQDGVCGAGDNCPNVENTAQRDHDQDGFGDACDDTPLYCDSRGGDTDGDEVCDDVDNCVDTPNAEQVDEDKDGIGDLCDPVVTDEDACLGTGGDLDSDNWCGATDNCPNEFNPTQSDVDDDGIGDACDPEDCDGIDNDGDGKIDEDFADSDDDGVADCVDVCPDTVNVDEDGDGILDCIDACPGDAENDPDNDGICSDVDNCPDVYNWNQSDKDGDGIGDYCDVEECDGIDNDGYGIDEGMDDSDDDGFCDEIDPCPDDPTNDADDDGLCVPDDNCPGTSNADQADADDDGIGDLCDQDSTEGCGDAATLWAGGSVTLDEDLQVVDGVFDSDRELTYLSGASLSGQFANAIFALRDDGSVAWSILVGDGATELTLSKDGATLYYHRPTAEDIGTIDLSERRKCHGFPVYASSVRLDTMPGAGQRVVVQNTERIEIYSGGRRLPNTHSPSYYYYYRRAVAFDSDSIYYGYINSYYDDRWLEVDDQGIASASSIALDIAPIFSDGTHIFGRGGEVADPLVPTVLGTVGYVGYGGEVDPDRKEIYGTYSGSDGSGLRICEYETFGCQKKQVHESYWSATKLLRWGMDGLVAIETDGSLALLDGYLD